MFVDSSAFLSILKGADDAALLLEKIKAAADRARQARAFGLRS